MPGEILESAREDLATTVEGDFGSSITLFFPSAETLTLFGQVNRTTAMFDPQTNLQVNLPKHSVTLRVSSLGNRTISEGQKVSVMGIEYKIVDPKPDYTLGIVTFQLSEVKNSQPRFIKNYGN